MDIAAPPTCTVFSEAPSDVPVVAKPNASAVAAVAASRPKRLDMFLS